MAQETRLTIRIEPELKEKAQAKAKAEDLTLSQLIRRYLMQYVTEDKEKPQKED